MSRPMQIKITNDVSIVLNNVVSYAVEKGLAYKRLKKDVKLDEKGNYSDESFEVSAADTISMYFIGGEGLTFRVGEAITREDFDRVSKILKTLEFKLRDEGKSSSDKPIKGTA